MSIFRAKDAYTPRPVVYPDGTRAYGKISLGVAYGRKNEEEYWWSFFKDGTRGVQIHFDGHLTSGEIVEVDTRFAAPASCQDPALVAVASVQHKMKAGRIMLAQILQAAGLEDLEDWSDIDGIDCEVTLSTYTDTRGEAKQGIRLVRQWFNPQRRGGNKYAQGVTFGTEKAC